MVDCNSKWDKTFADLEIWKTIVRPCSQFL